MADPPDYPGTPRWVKISGIAFTILAVLVVIVIATGLGGPHGPGLHAPEEAGGQSGSALTGGESKAGHMPAGSHQ